MKYLEKNWILIFALFALLGCLFSRCGMAPTDSQYLVIDEIEKWGSCCEYGTAQTWYFTAPCGKFNIGDTVWVNYLKQVNQDTIQ